MVAVSIMVVDRVGRRPLIGESKEAYSSAHSCWNERVDLALVTGLALLACVLLTEALLQWKYLGTSNKAGNAACILFIFMFIAVFQVGDPFRLFWYARNTDRTGWGQLVDAPTFIWTAEIFPTHLRAKGVSLSISSIFVGTITFTAPSPLAFRNM